MKILKLELENYKHWDKFTIEFNPDETNIYGANGTGKTSIVDAVMFLLFGKYSDGTSDLGKCQPERNGIILEDLIVKIAATFEHNGGFKKLAKIIKRTEKRSRGEVIGTFINEVEYYTDIDMPPCRMKDYNMVVDSMINEDLFRLITSPNHFHTLNWTERRTKLLGLISIDEKSIIERDSRFKVLFENLNGSNLHDYQTKIKSERNKAKEKIKDIASRIDENKSSIQKVDENAIKEQISVLEMQLKTVVTQIADFDKQQENLNAENAKIQKQIADLNKQKRELELDVDTKNNEILFALKKTVNDKATEYREKQNETNNLRKELAGLQEILAKNIANMNDLRATIQEIKEHELDLSGMQTTCPTCKQELPSDNIELEKKKMITNFNKNKETQIANINKTGLALKNDNNEIDSKIQSIEKQITILEEIIVKLGTEGAEAKIKRDSFVANKPDIAEYDKKISELMQKVIKAETNTDLLNKSQNIQSEINKLNKELNKVENNKKIELRIKDLEQERIGLVQLIANTENFEDLIIEFNKTKIVAIENKLNSLFTICKFKMFETVQSTNEEKEACVTLCGTEGISFDKANRALQINAGLDICRVFAKMAQVKAPVFIDNRESVQVIEPDMQTQIINLFVLPIPKKENSIIL